MHVTLRWCRSAAYQHEYFCHTWIFYPARGQHQFILLLCIYEADYIGLHIGHTLTILYILHCLTMHKHLIDFNNARNDGNGEACTYNLQAVIISTYITQLWLTPSNATHTALCCLKFKQKCKSKRNQTFPEVQHQARYLNLSLLTLYAQ